MAELLKREHDLVVLKVELLDAPGRTEDVARFTLQGRVEGRLVDLDGTEFPLERLGLDRVLDPRGNARAGADAISLPEDFLDGLRQVRIAHGVEQRPLWVHLVKPYGPLRFVPWERQLVQALGVPVLMLPDFIFPRPREATASLEVALCASAPLGYEDHSVRQALDRVIASVLRGSPRRTRVQVFTDAPIAPALRERWRDALAAGQLRVHDPAEAAPYVQADPGSRLLDRSGVLRSPWLLWMRQALRARAVDVVHFCCHGHLSRGRGALLFAQSPMDRSDEYLAGPVGAVELQTFLTQVGAWSTAFGSLPDNHSALGLRALADEIAQSRPGPMLMHDLRLDANGAALAAAYGFVYAPEPVAAPLSPALFIYCQPYLSRDVPSTAAPTPAPAPADRKLLPGRLNLLPRREARRKGGKRIVHYRAPDDGRRFKRHNVIVRSPVKHAVLLPGPGPSGAEPPPGAVEVRAPSPAASQSGPARFMRVSVPEVARNEVQAAQARAAEQPAATDALFAAASDNAQPWLAATERLADELQLRYQALTRDELLPESLARECSSTLETTLGDLRSAVADLARRRGGGS